MNQSATLEMPNLTAKTPANQPSSDHRQAANRARNYSQKGNLAANADARFAEKPRARRESGFPAKSGISAENPRYIRNSAAESRTENSGDNDIFSAVGGTPFREIFDRVVGALQPAATENAAAPDGEAESQTADSALAEIEELLANGLFAPLQPLTSQQQEIITKIALLAADGGLDPKLLAELNQAERAQLADFLTRDATGLFAATENLPPMLASLPDLPADDLASAPKFIADAALALRQFAALREQLANAPCRDTALIGDLVKLNELPALAVDRLAQSILKTLPAAPPETTLRELLAQTPPENPLAAMNDTLAQIRANANANDRALPALPADLPPVITKSLAIEIINVNNQETAAAEKELAVLDGLTRNAPLRAALIAQIANSEKLPAAVNEQALQDNLGKTAWAEDLAAAFADAAAPETELEVSISENSTAALPPENSENSAPKSRVAANETSNSISGTVIGNSENDDAGARQEIPNAEKSKPDAAAENFDRREEHSAAGGKPASDEKTAIANHRETPDKKIDDPKISAATDGKGTSSKTAKTKVSAPPANDSAIETRESAVKKSAAFAEILFDRDHDASGKIAIAARDNQQDFAAPSAADTNREAGSRQAILQENINKLAALIEQNRAGQTLKSLTLALNPPELGKVTVELQLSSNGSVSATVRAENDAARTLLMSGLDSLRKSLETRGVSLEQFNVELDGKDAGAQEQNRQQNSAPHGGDWFDALADERDRRARNHARDLRYQDNAAGKESGGDEFDETPSLRLRAGSSFELIA